MTTRSANLARSPTTVETRPQLGHDSLGRPANILCFQPVADEVGGGLGLGLDPVDYLLLNESGGAGIVIPGLGAIHAQTQHIEMRIFAPGECDGAIQLSRRGRWVGHDREDGFVGHVCFSAWEIALKYDGSGGFAASL